MEVEIILQRQGDEYPDITNASRRIGAKNSVIAKKWCDYHRSFDRLGIALQLKRNASISFQRRILFLAKDIPTRRLRDIYSTVCDLERC